MVKATVDKKLNRLVILSGIMIGVTLFIGVAFIYVPFLNRTKSLREEILLEREKNILVGRIRGLGKHLKVYKKQIPRGRGVSWLISEVSDMASKENIEVSVIKPGIPEDKGLYTKLHVILTTFCTYDQLGKFVSRIESSDNFLKIEGINIKRLDSDEGFDVKGSKFKPFDVKSNIVISTIILKD
ncbi:MAG: type 4a pilus biogenesis protein PilO [Candidatus Omnitrophica bacterium]|nr:type 4a pilus biogenesis protein PilO [Candidatus Omnitrophota bacterium]